MKRAETPWVQRYLDGGWQWRMKSGGAPHLTRDDRTLCGRAAATYDLRADMSVWIGCLSCRDIAGGIIFDRQGGVAL